MKSNPPEADAYIVGSDQVWNFGKGNLRIFKNVIHSYFLDFGKSETKRISYAASWGGRNNFLGNEKSEIQKLLKNFDFISVREKMESIFVNKLVEMTQNGCAIRHCF